MIIVSLPITPTVPWIIVSSTNFWLSHLLIKFYNDWIIFISSSKLSIVFTLLTNTNFIRLLFHQLSKISNNLIALFIAIWNGKKQKKSQVLQWKDHYAKKFKRHYLCSSQKLASAQTIGSAFLEWVRKVQNSKQKPDLLKTIDCLIDGSGSVNGDHVNFLKKT